MRYLFFGGQDSTFAQIVLDGLIKAGFPPLAAFRDAKAPLNSEELKKLKADFFLVAAFGKIFKKDLIAIPPKGVIGVHPSLLPKYRGPSPIQSALLAEEETGTTLFLIDEKVDHGPIVSSAQCQVSSEDTYATLEEKLAKSSVDLILNTLPQWLADEIQPRPQKESEAAYTQKFSAEDGLVDLKNDNPKKIWLKIRALNPEPGTWAMVKLENGRELRLKLLKADFSGNQLQLKTVQPEGKKIMDFKDFLNGYPMI